MESFDHLPPMTKSPSKSLSAASLPKERRLRLHRHGEDFKGWEDFKEWGRKMGLFKLEIILNIIRLTLVRSAGGYA